MKRWKQALIYLFGAVILASWANASSIKSWVSGEALSVTDLNSNFSHIHNTMVGGHGARLVNADVSASAAIAHSKLATPSLIPKVWAIVNTCTSTPCTAPEKVGVTSVTRASTGVYTVNLTATRTNANYAPFVTSTGADAFRQCAVTSYNTTTIGVGCVLISSDGGVNGVADDGFSVTLLDVE